MFKMWYCVGDWNKCVDAKMEQSPCALFCELNVIGFKEPLPILIQYLVIRMIGITISANEDDVLDVTIWCHRYIYMWFCYKN